MTDVAKMSVEELTAAIEAFTSTQCTGSIPCPVPHNEIAEFRRRSSLYEELREALRKLHSAVDAELMGDSDLPEDDSELMKAMQRAAELCFPLPNSLSGTPQP